MPCFIPIGTAQRIANLPYGANLRMRCSVISVLLIRINIFYIVNPVSGVYRYLLTYYAEGARQCGVGNQCLFSWHAGAIFYFLNIDFHFPHVDRYRCVLDATTTQEKACLLGASAPHGAVIKRPVRTARPPQTAVTGLRFEKGCRASFFFIWALSSAMLYTSKYTVRCQVSSASSFLLSQLPPRGCRRFYTYCMFREKRPSR